MSALGVPESLTEDHFLCPICLTIFSDPVTTPCGHNFCKTCLTATWSNTDEFCQCPTCNKRFHGIPEFSTNTILAQISVQIKKRRVEVQESPDATCQRVPTPMGHKLTDPVDNVERQCEKHQMLLEFFCRKEQLCVCVLCREADHRGHQTVPVGEEAALQKHTIRSRKGKVKKMIQNRMGKITELTSSSEEIIEKAMKEKELYNKLFRTLMNKVQEKEKNLASYIDNILSESLSKNDSMVEELQREITELQKRHSELEKLEQNQDPFQFLLALAALSRVSGNKGLIQRQVYSDPFVQTVRRAMSHLTRTFQEQLKTLTGMELTRMREYREAVTFDPSTAGVHLVMTDIRVKYYNIARRRPSSESERFQLSMVFGRNGFTSGRHYWEVQVGRRCNWDVGVAKESVSRTQKFITKTNGYFTFGKRGGEYKAYRKFYEVVNLSPRPRKIGVYLDYEAGRVSFYDIGQKLHIYSYKRQKFTEKLFPCFYLNSKAKKSEALFILPKND